MPAKTAAKTADNSANQAASDELQKYTGFSVEELKGIESFEDVERLFSQRGEKVDSASDALGDGFALLDKEQKDILLDVPTMFVSWIFTKGDFDGEFVSARVVCRMPNGTLGKYILNDGGTGICAQLRQYTDTEHKQGGLFAQKGLRKSEYSNEFTEHGVTYYVNTSA